jgi:hypothetical protein
MAEHHRHDDQITIRTELGAVFVSLELSRSAWLMTSLSPGRGEKMSKHQLRGDVAGLLARCAQLRDKVRARTGRLVPLVIIQEAGLDGFWIHRVLEGEGIESHIVDPASIATARRRRRAKTDRIDGEALVRALLAHKRGEPRVCAMLKAPTPQEEDRRCTGAGARGWRSSRPAMVVRCRRISRHRSAANWTGSTFSSIRSRRWRRSGMPCSLKPTRTGRPRLPLRLRC